MTILGISAYYHDSAAALVIDGKIVAAAEEERFNRIKHYNGFPSLAIQFCLTYAHISLQDVDKIVFYEKPFLKFERILKCHINYAPHSIKTFLSAMPIWLKEKLNMRATIKKELKKTFDSFSAGIEFCQHHLSHAALAYCTSPFSHCAVLVIDAVGENSTSSIVKVDESGYKLLEYQQFPHSVGLLYSAFTYYLGFKVNSDEYKVMGLAPYGNRASSDYNRIKNIIISELLSIEKNGGIKLNERYFSFMYSDRMVKDDTWHNLFGFAKRQPEQSILSYHKDMALAIQDVTEHIIQKMADYARQITGEEYLCIVGGCALNCSAIGKLILSSNPGTIYVPFAPGDDGAAIGCALYSSDFQLSSISAFTSPYLGIDYSDKEIIDALEKSKLSYHLIKENILLYSLISEEIANGKIIGWFQGRMEFGPRALGNRSILADARNPEMKDLVNAKIKFRESFRPFAPAVLKEYAEHIFFHAENSPYMSTTFILQDGQTYFPAITHVDNTSRIQTVTKEDNEKFYMLLYTFYSLTGCPMLLNTSFNVMGEPIVCSPSDAISTFLNSGIDILVINNYIIHK